MHPYTMKIQNISTSLLVNMSFTFADLKKLHLIFAKKTPDTCESPAISNTLTRNMHESAFLRIKIEKIRSQVCILISMKPSQ